MNSMMTNEERDRKAAEIRSRILNVLPAATYQMDRFLQFVDVVLSDRTESACVEVGPQPRLHLNPQFLRKYCKRDEHLLMLVMHELYHVILGHTRLFPRLIMTKPIHLSITLKDAREPFRILKRLCKPKPGEEAVLSYDGACLHIECSGVTVAPGASGEWDGQARVLGTSLMAVVKHPPAGDPLVFTVGEGLTINSITIPCVWQPPWSKIIDLPVNYTLEDVAALGDRYTEQEIVESGLGNIYKRAVLEFPRRARNGQFKSQGNAKGKAKGKPEDPRQLRFWT